jgi:transcriptional regulator with XRE-family HTH domain
MKMDIGLSLRIIRARDRLTNAQIAERFGCHPMHVSKMANCPTASSRTIERLSEIFDMSASEFITLGETNQPAEVNNGANTHCKA